MSKRTTLLLAVFLTASNIFSDCCTTDCKVAQKIEVCGTHPITKTCPGIDQPSCSEIIDMNVDICETDYVICRNAIQAAPCGVCPAQCAGIEEACGWEIPVCTATTGLGNSETSIGQNTDPTGG